MEFSYDELVFISSCIVSLLKLKPSGRMSESEIEVFEKLVSLDNKINNYLKHF